jgi:hypothetical protein
LEIKISCPYNNCIHNSSEGVCTKKELPLKVRSEEFPGRGEPDYSLPLLIIDISKCFESKDGTDVLAR